MFTDRSLAAVVGLGTCVVAAVTMKCWGEDAWPVIIFADGSTTVCKRIFDSRIPDRIGFWVRLDEDIL
jgi:hypothetical protein